nr:hypothetical protein [Tanacetum cinerariifolium]
MEIKANRKRREVGFNVGDKGTGGEVVTSLPGEIRDGQHLEQPLAVCDSRAVLKNGSPVQQDKVISEGRGSVTPELGKDKRTKRALAWHEDFVMG